MKKMNKIVIRRNSGFFSDFLTILAGIKYCYDNNLNFYVDWKNTSYPVENDENLFDLFFNQEKSEMVPDVIHNDLTPYGYQFTEVANVTDEKELHKFYKPFSELLDNLKILKTPFFESINKNYFGNQKVLGIHKRGTDHYLHGELLPDEYYMNKINEEFKIKSYDKIFLITDDLNSLNFFQRELGNMLLYTNSFRDNGNVGVHRRWDIDRSNIAKEVVIDSYLLSLTDKKIITKSNVSTFSVLCNLSEDNFVYIDKHKIY